MDEFPIKKIIVVGVIILCCLGVVCFTIVKMRTLNIQEIEIHEQAEVDRTEIIQDEKSDRGHWLWGRLGMEDEKRGMLTNE